METERVYENKTFSILLITTSLILLGSGIFSVQFFATQYGIGAGGIIESTAANVPITSILQYASSQTNFFLVAILESYLLIGISSVLLVMAFALWMHGQNGYERYMRFYVPLHIMLTAVYAILLIIIYSSFDFSFYSTSLDITYLAIVLSILIDSYLGYKVYELTLRKSFRGIQILPSKPYSNMLKLREEMFSKLSGDVGIVDKHFNSQALENLHRLITDNKNIKKITVITYNEMFDSSFNTDYRELKSELQNFGIEFMIKIMKQEEAAEQHERFIFDDLVAYKIPPMNIINKKSEHIVRMSRRDAEIRFKQLVFNSTKV